MVSTVALVRLLAAIPAVALAAKDFDTKDITYREVGARNTIDWRMWLEKDGDPISFWHDIPLYPDPKDKSIIHYYTEIPRWTQGKLETKRDEPLNPIFHDEKKDAPRFIYNVWPHKTYPFNYGSIPQTWENPNHEHDFTGFPGDNDPIDIFEISSVRPSFTGEIKKVKVLGGLAMIDDETTDWKVIAIDTEDPLSQIVDSVEDLDKYRPGIRQEFYDWFIYYKVVKGDGLNTIIGKDYQNATFMQDIIQESHKYWKQLVKGKADANEIATNQTSHPKFCSSYIDSKDATKEFDIPKKSKILPAKEMPEEYAQWFFLDENFDLIELPSQ